MYSRISRPYALACLLATISSYCLWMLVKSGKKRYWIVYAVSTVLALYSNLFVCPLVAGQSIFAFVMLWKRRKVLLKWIGLQVIVLLCIAPWLYYSMAGAIEFGAGTSYRASQLGRSAKLLYLPFAFSLGETVHPFNISVVVPAAIGFGVAFLAGLILTVRTRRAELLLFHASFWTVFVPGIFFGAAAPKHLSICLPFFIGILALGVMAIRTVLLKRLLIILIVGCSAASLANYYAGKQFHDADMVTPWRSIVGEIEKGEAPGDVLLIGYRANPGVRNMFQRYYRGSLKPTWLYEEGNDWREVLDRTVREHGRTWLLLHDIDQRQERRGRIYSRLTVKMCKPFQLEEHTLMGLREGIGNVAKYRSHLYILYLVEEAPPEDSH